MPSAITGPSRHRRLAELNFKERGDAPWPIGFAWLLVTGVPAGMTCEGVKVGPYAYVEDKGDAGTPGPGDFDDFEVSWDLLAAGAWNVRPFRSSCDPAIPAQARDRLRRARAVYYVPTHPESGLYRVHGARMLARRNRGHFVDHGMLAPDLRELLARAQNAADTLSTSRAAAAGRIEDPAPEAARDEWEIACTLRDLTSLRGRHALAAADGRDGPPWVQEVIDSVTARLGALERYAAKVAAADAALARQEGALNAPDEDTLDQAAAVTPPAPARAEDDSDVVDLVASTGRDEHAIADLEQLAELADLTTRAIQDTTPARGAAPDPGGQT